MYARKYYFIIYRRNLYTMNISYRISAATIYQETVQHATHLFLCKVFTFDLFDLFAIRSIFIKFTQFTIHLIHLFHFHLFTFSSRLLSLSPPISLTIHPSTSQHPGQRLKKSGTTLSFLAKMY